MVLRVDAIGISRTQTISQRSFRGKIRISHVGGFSPEFSNMFLVYFCVVLASLRFPMCVAAGKGILLLRVF